LERHRRLPTRSPVRCPRCRRLHSGKGLCPGCRADKRAAIRWVYRCAEWSLLRDQVLSEEPVCRICRAPAPTEVDHIRSLLAAPRLALVRSNLQALCRVCHGRKTRQED
jgi:5-methylcytosine-specific restriction endonuclease McrA